MFKQAATYNNTTDLQEHSETDTAYITKRIDDVTVTKTITVRANQKSWLTGEVYRLLKSRNAAFRAGDEEGLKTARANLSRGIREAKRQYSRKITHCFSNNRDTLSLWHGIQTIVDYKPHHRPVNAPSPCWTSWMPSSLALSHKTAPLHRRLHLLPATRWWRCPRTVWGDPSAGSMHAKPRVLTTFLGVYWENVQSGCFPHMLQGYHYHSSPEEVISILLQWLPAIHTGLSSWSALND